MTQPAAIILAAGGSTRMGSPKALLDLHGRTLIEAHVASLSVCCSPIIVVLGGHGEEIDAVLPSHVIRVWNKDWRTSETRDSIALGLEGLSHDQQVVVTPVDVPPVPVDVLEQMISCEGPAVPCDEEQPGHPVVIVAGPARTDLASQPLHQHLSEATLVDVDWPDCTVGFNTPEEWNAWRN